MSISLYAGPISDAKDLFIKLLTDELKIGKPTSEQIFNKIIKSFLKKLRDDIFIIAESPYTDKVYRDSYYQYYSSKLNNYLRDCSRISFFEGHIDINDFQDKKKHDDLQNKYRGFMVLRPTDPNVIGRSVISPLALKENGFCCCTSSFNTTVYGVKFTANGFPHSSQDTETITCAETTLWAVMEYFSNKYSLYQPILPSGIINTLNKISYERQLPSRGLEIDKMSYALKEFGFGSRIYSEEQYKEDFGKLFSCYVESGIPLIAAMSNMNGIAHALLAIGYKDIEPQDIDSLISNPVYPNNIKIFDLDSAEKQYVFIDDNKPAYQCASLRNPAAHYPPEWHSCTIKFFIAPLYTKIYLEAFEAKKLFITFLTQGPEPLPGNSEIVIRCYLASSRSFKHYLSANNTIANDFRDILIETVMPKFIWVAELSTKYLIKNQKANGIMILDATEPNLSNIKPLIMAAYHNKIISYNPALRKLESKMLTLQEFLIFKDNLTHFQP